MNGEDYHSYPKEAFEEMEAELAWAKTLLRLIRDKADLRYNGKRGLLAFSDLKDAARKELAK